MIVITRKGIRTVFIFCIIFLFGTMALIPNAPFTEALADHSVFMESIVVDPGHGGEDGGAVSEDGTEESQVNLEISHRLRDLFEFSGQHVYMTRSEDRSLDHGESTIKARKRSDLKSRVELVNSSHASALITIHQNSLPTSPVTNGAQVFYNAQPGAAELSGKIQDHLNLVVNQGHPKKTRKSPDIYLMKHISVPGILVECGFLSNYEETILLKNPNHQVKLVAAIVSGYLSGRS